MSRSGRALLAAALLVLLLYLALASAPARLLPHFIEDQPLQLSAMSGSLLRGEAGRAVLRTAAGPLQLGELRWRLEPLSLLRLAPRLAIESAWGRQRIAARVEPRGANAVLLLDVTLRVDAQLARQFAPVDLRGSLEADLARLEIDGQRLLHAEGRAVWRDAAWQSPRGAQALGSYAVELTSPAAGEVVGTVLTVAGPVEVSGTATLTDGRYAIDALIGPAAAMDRELQHALSLIAAPEENGYLLRLDGALAAPR